MSNISFETKTSDNLGKQHNFTRYSHTPNVVILRQTVQAICSGYKLPLLEFRGQNIGHNDLFIMSSLDPFGHGISSAYVIQYKEHSSDKVVFSYIHEEFTLKYF